MKRSLVVSILAVIILAFLVSACTPEETGTISFSSPYWGQIIQDDFLEDSPSIPLVVGSTYQTDKVVHFLVNNEEPFDCSVKANVVDQICSSVVLTEAGEYTIRAEVELLDGTVSISEVVFRWDPQETGTILITSPSMDEVVRDGYLGIPSQSISVLISSTFRRDKLVQYTVGGQTETVSCLVKANVVDQECPPVILTESGEYIITAEVTLRDGSISTKQVWFKWLPFSRLDKTMYLWSFNDSPVGGYLLAYVAVILLVSLLVFFITKDWVPVLVWNSVVTAIVVATLFFLPSAGPAVSTNCWLVPLLIIIGSIAVAMRRYPRPTLVAHRDDGSQIRYLSRPRNKRADKKIVINVKDINAELRVDEKFLKKAGGNDGPGTVNQTVDND